MGKPCKQIYSSSWEAPHLSIADRRTDMFSLMSCKICCVYSTGQACSIFTDSWTGKAYSIIPTWLFLFIWLEISKRALLAVQLLWRYQGCHHIQEHQNPVSVASFLLAFWSLGDLTSLAALWVPAHLLIIELFEYWSTWQLAVVSRSLGLKWCPWLQELGFIGWTCHDSLQADLLYISQNLILYSK